MKREIEYHWRIREHMARAGMKNSRDLARDGFEDALQKARMADVVLLFLGEEQILSGEAHYGFRSPKLHHHP